MAKRFEIEVGRKVEFGKNRESWEIPTTDGRSRKGTGPMPPSAMKNDHRGQVAIVLGGVALALCVIILLVLAALAGVVAAIGPARRASRLNVLEALAYE